MSNCLIFALLLVFLCRSRGFQYDSGRDFVVAELIHRDSLISPFYNSSKTMTERLREAVTRSHNRINASNSSLHFDKKDVVSQMKPDKVDYVMKIYSAKFHQELLVMASTRSAFTWIQCRPYENVAFFDSATDDGYKELLGNSKECRDAIYDPYLGISFTSSTTFGCGYEYSYLEKVETRGILSRAEFYLDSADTKSFEYRFSLLFGCCTHRFKSTFTDRIQGMAGLGFGDLSLVSQLAKFLEIKKKFSYCLHPLGSDIPNKLIFGKAAEFSGQRVSTPFKTNTNSPYYYLTLKHVVVLSGRTQTVTTQLPTENNIIIDSGTMVTSLPERTFDEVRSIVKEYLEIPPMAEKPTNPLKLCYNIDEANRARLLNIKLYFKGPQDDNSITLVYENIFIEYKDDDMICMNIVAATIGEVPVLGNMAQVGFRVEYNIRKKKIYFAPTDCTKFGNPS